MRFQALIDSNQVSSVVSFLARRNTTTFGNVLIDTTAVEGTSGALVRFGSKSGLAAVVISVPDLNVTDTAHFTVSPTS